MTGKRSPYLRFGLLVAATAFLLDQVSKWVVIGPLSLEAKRVIGVLPIFNLTWAENCGISLSMFSDCNDTTRWTLVAVTAFVAAAVAFWMTREQAKGDVVALALILGGALGNIVDRATLGYVVDYILFHTETWSFAVFNLADAFISVGAAMVVLQEILDWRDRDDPGGKDPSPNA